MDTENVYIVEWYYWYGDSEGVEQRSNLLAAFRDFDMARLYCNRKMREDYDNNPDLIGMDIEISDEIRNNTFTYMYTGRFSEQGYIITVMPLW